MIWHDMAKMLMITKAKCFLKKKSPKAKCIASKKIKPWNYLLEFFFKILKRLKKIIILIFLNNLMTKNSPIEMNKLEFWIKYNNRKYLLKKAFLKFLKG
jgi:hypothetical protein